MPTSISEQRDNSYIEIENKMRIILALKHMYCRKDIEDFISDYCTNKYNLHDTIGIESQEIVDEINLAIYGRICLLKEQVKDYLEICIPIPKESKDDQTDCSGYVPNSYTDLKF